MSDHCDSPGDRVPIDEICEHFVVGWVEMTWISKGAGVSVAVLVMVAGSCARIIFNYMWLYKCILITVMLDNKPFWNWIEIENAFPWMKIKLHVFLFEFHWNMPPGLPLWSLGSDDGLAPNRQAIIWTNADLVYWCTYVSLGINELTISQHWSQVMAWHWARRHSSTWSNQDLPSLL